MYVRVTRGRYDTSREDAPQRLGEDVLVPAFRRLPGFRKYHGGINRTNGTLVAVSYWETQEQANTLRDRIGDVMAQVAAAGIELEPAEVYEVVAES